MFFEKAIDLTDRKSMVSFLENHFRYYTMNSWNRSTSYANNVKIYNLGLSEEQAEQAYGILDLDLDRTELDLNIQQIFSEFQAKTGYAMGFNGRSSGYLVLYDTQYDPDTETLNVYPGRSIDADEDFGNTDDWPMEQLKERVELICTFDRTCDEVRDLFLSYCDPDCFHTEEVMIPKTIHYLCRKEEE